MNIYNYCIKTGRPFLFPSGSDLHMIRHDPYRQILNWTWVKNDTREGDFDWSDLVECIKQTPGMKQYL